MPPDGGMQGRSFYSSLVFERATRSGSKAVERRLIPLITMSGAVKGMDTNDSCSAPITGSTGMDGFRVAWDAKRISTRAVPRSLLPIHVRARVALGVCVPVVVLLAE